MKPTDPWGNPRYDAADERPPFPKGHWRNETIAGKCYHEARHEEESERKARKEQAKRERNEEEGIEE
jgi:hypothetical protein